MDTSRASTAELIAGVGGLALFLFLFFDWFGVVSAWEGFDVIDVVLAVIGLGAAALVAARAAGIELALPGGPGVILALDGFAAAVITLTFLLEGEERKVGIWLAFLASVAIAYGGWQAIKGVPTAAPRRPAAEPPPGGAPPPTP
jgi:TRAP-type uncharacterized transport system fused permease subunit